MYRRRTISTPSIRALLATIALSLLACSIVAQQAGGGTELPLANDELVAAEQAFRRAVRAEPEAAAAWLGLARVLERQERPLEALEAARQALKLAPDDPQAGLATARQLARLGADQEALELLAEVRQLAPLEPEGTLLAAFLLKAASRYDEAASVLEAGIDGGLSQPEIAAELGWVLLDLDRRPRALTIAAVALEQHPRHPALTAVTGLALVGEGSRRAEAIERLRTALELGFEPVGPIDLEIGSLLLEEGDFTAAVEALERATERMPESIEGHYRLGRALRSAGDREGARAALERFQQLSRAHDEAERTAGEIGTILNEAQALANDNQLDAALGQVEALLESHSDQPRALALKAKVLFSRGESQAALEAVQEARKMAPGQVEPHFLEGLFQLSMGFPVEAESALRQALALAPSTAEASALLAMALAKQQRFAEAAERFQEALDHGADSPALRLGYAAALESLGQMEESRQQQAAYESLTGN